MDPFYIMQLCSSIVRHDDTYTALTALTDSKMFVQNFVITHDSWNAAGGTIPKMTGDLPEILWSL